MKAKDLRVGDIYILDNYHKFEVKDKTENGLKLFYITSDYYSRRGEIIPFEDVDGVNNYRNFKLLNKYVENTELARFMYPDAEVLEDGKLRIKVR